LGLALPLAESVFELCSSGFPDPLRPRPPSSSPSPPAPLPSPPPRRAVEPTFGAFLLDAPLPGDAPSLPSTERTARPVSAVLPPKGASTPVPEFEVPPSWLPTRAAVKPTPAAEEEDEPAAPRTPLRHRPNRPRRDGPKRGDDDPGESRWGPKVWHNDGGHLRWYYRHRPPMAPPVRRAQPVTPFGPVGRDVVGPVVGPQ
jgi:hypothetical protein